MNGSPLAVIYDRPMRLRAVLTIACICFAVIPAARAIDCKSTVSGDLRIHSLASDIFNNTRSIRVLLPPGYDAAENRSKRYPVLYMLDGQNLFDACLSDVSHVEWRLDETVYRLIREKAIPEMIVVGVDHAGAKRATSFSRIATPSIPVWRSLPASTSRIFSQPKCCRS